MTMSVEEPVVATQRAEPVGPRDAFAAARGVRVAAPARLHLGFLDPAATLGRRFGSLGVVVDGFETVVELRPATVDLASASDVALQGQLPRARDALAAMRRHTGWMQPLHLRLAESVPLHAGFGSGTQLALAIGRAFAQLGGLALSTPEIARMTGRGLRSGVGIAGFDRGGLLLDGGPSADGALAPLLSRVEMPMLWRVLLVVDPRRRGLNGDHERAALAALPAMPQEVAARICHEVLMRVLPGAATSEFEPFAAGISAIQQLVGAHFARAQEAGAFASPAVAKLIEWIAHNTPAGTGQSSWGPTGFAFLPSRAAAMQAVAAAHTAGVVDPALALHVATARNHGATMTLTAPPSDSTQPASGHND